jgi:hypothetical protein
MGIEQNINFNNIENLKPLKNEYVFDINNYDLNDEELQNYLENLKEENSPLYNDILNSIAEKESDKYHKNNIPPKLIKKDKTNDSVKLEIESEKEKDSEEPIKEDPGYEYFGRFSELKNISNKIKQKIHKTKYKSKKELSYPFDLYK